MASDAYISTTDKAQAKTVHLNSAGAISAPMAYAVWDRNALAAHVICKTSAEAETELKSLLAKRGDLTEKNGELCVITVPA